MAVNEFGKGRSIPYSFENARLLYKAMIRTARKDLYRGYSGDINTECNYYPTSNQYAVVNNSKEKQTTDFYDVNGSKQALTLCPMEIRCIKE